MPSKLGVTRYLEIMKENDYEGSIFVPDWNSTYHDLKDLRNARNEAVHGDIESILFDNEDIDWIINLKNRILSNSDPIAKLRKAKQARKAAQSKKRNTTPYYPTTSSSKGSSKNKSKLLLTAAVILILFIYILLHYFN